jgi:hypothetical protein
MIVRAKFLLEDGQSILAMDEHGRTHTTSPNGTFRMEADMDHTIPGFLAAGGEIEPFDGTCEFGPGPSLKTVPQAIF